jgi:hypothetical protein
MWLSALPSVAELQPNAHVSGRAAGPGVADSRGLANRLIFNDFTCSIVAVRAN